MKRLTRNSGLTLVEVILALAILGILAMSFLTVFTNSFSNIAAMGNRTNAISEAQAIMDSIYEADKITLNATVIDTILTTNGFSNFQSGTQSDIDNPLYAPPIYIRYCVATEVRGSFNGYKVSVLVFYQGGKHSITLTSLIPKGGSI